MAISGDLAQGDDATLLMELAGTTAGIDHDVLQVDGGVSLDGTLEVSLLDGFEPDLGDSFDILDFGSITGEFDSIRLPDLDGGLAWDVSALLADGSLSVVPEPSSVVLLLGVWLSVLATRRRGSSGVH